MGILNSPSSRVVKDSMPSRCRILRCINFVTGESSPNSFLNMMNLYLVKFEAGWILNKRALLFCLFESESWPKKTNQPGKSWPNFIFAAMNLDSIVIEKRWTDDESWPNDFVKKGEQRWKLEVGRFKMPFDVCIGIYIFKAHLFLNVKYLYTETGRIQVGTFLNFPVILQIHSIMLCYVTLTSNITVDRMKDLVNEEQLKCWSGETHFQRLQKYFDYCNQFFAFPRNGKSLQLGIMCYLNSVLFNACQLHFVEDYFMDYWIQNSMNTMTLSLPDPFISPIWLDHTNLYTKQRP